MYRNGAITRTEVPPNGVPVQMTVGYNEQLEAFLGNNSYPLGAGTHTGTLTVTPGPDQSSSIAFPYNISHN